MVRRWDLTSLPPSTEKEQPRAPGPDAPRVPSERRIPQVLFTSSECRVVVVDLRAEEEMGEHHVRERALVQVLSGRVLVEAGGEAAECGAGTLLTFDPHEPHAVRALDETRLLLVLAPWPAPGHYVAGDDEHAQQLPANAAVEPVPGSVPTGRPS